MVRLMITYDIRDDKIRSKLFKLLERYGAWKQFSVFEMEVSSVQRVQIEHKIRDLVTTNDRVRIYVLCSRCKEEIVNIGEASPERMSHIV